MPPQHICVKYEKEFSLVVCNAPRLVALGSAGLERSVTSGPKPSWPVSPTPRKRAVPGTVDVVTLFLICFVCPPSCDNGEWGPSEVSTENEVIFRATRIIYLQKDRKRANSRTVIKNDWEKQQTLILQFSVQ